MDFKKYIEDIKDFPEEGIIFRDVTPLLKDKEAYKESIDTFAKWIDGLGVQVDVVAGPEASKSSIITTFSPGLILSA